MDSIVYRVLLVETDSEDAERIETALASAGEARFDVVTLEQLDAACAWVCDHDADVILLDLALPDGSGLAVFEAVHGCRPDIPIVILTSWQDEPVALSAVQAGAQDYIVKSKDTQAAIVRAIHYTVQRFGKGRTIRQREEHMRLLTEQLPCIFWTTDRQLRFTSFAGAGLQGHKIRSEHVAGRPLADYFDLEECGPEVIAAHRDAAAGDSTTIDVSWRERFYHVHVEPFRQADGQIIGAISVALDVTDQKLIDLELRLTRRIQEGLRPAQAPELPGFDIAGDSYPAAAAGGDYFDYFTMRDGSTGIVVCDVAGHGLGPAMMMSQTRAYLRAVAQHHDHPGRILNLVNQFLCSDNREERLIALFLAKLTVGARTLHYANAGHQGYLLRNEQPAERLEPTGIPLNISAEYRVAASGPIELLPGDVVLLYTDGVTESMTRAGEEFGTARMLELIHAQRQASARQMVDALFRSVRESLLDPSHRDDMTAVVMKVGPSPDDS